MIGGVIKSAYLSIFVIHHSFSYLFYFGALMQSSTAITHVSLQNCILTEILIYWLNISNLSLRRKSTHSWKDSFRDLRVRVSSTKPSSSPPRSWLCFAFYVLSKVCLWKSFISYFFEPLDDPLTMHIGEWRGGKGWLAWEGKTKDGQIYSFPLSVNTTEAFVVTTIPFGT